MESISNSKNICIFIDFIISIFDESSPRISYSFDSLWHAVHQFCAVFDHLCRIPYVSWILSTISNQVENWVELIFSLTMGHIFSIRFESREYASQSSTSKVCSWRKNIDIADLWQGALSCWKTAWPPTNYWEIWGTKWFCNIDTHCGSLIVPVTETSGPTPFDEKQPHIICHWRKGQCWAVCAICNFSLRVWHTKWGHGGDISNAVSSEKMTWWVNTLKIHAIIE